MDTDPVSPDPEILPVAGDIGACVTACMSSTFRELLGQRCESIDIVRMAESELTIRVGASCQDTSVVGGKQSMLKAGCNSLDASRDVYL
jgi:hypothetical protein